LWRERVESCLPTVPPNFPLSFSGLPLGNNVAELQCACAAEKLLLRRGKFIHKENWRRHYCKLHVAATLQ